MRIMAIRRQALFRRTSSVPWTECNFCWACWTGAFPFHRSRPSSGSLRLNSSPGRALFTATPDARHSNPLGSLHDGYISTLLDSCMACAVHSKLRAGQSHTTLELEVNFARALSADTGPVSAIGTVIQVGRQIATAEGRLVDARDRLLGHATTTCLLSSIPAK